MPNRRLTRKEREKLSATSMLARNSKGDLTNQKIDKKRFTKAHAGIIRTAAQYRNVERIFVHPTIKRELCRQNPSKPKWLAKIRAQYGHHYHFHVRIGCPSSSPGCKKQARVPSMGCDKATMDYWFKVAYGPRKKPKKTTKKKAKPRKKRQITMKDLPKQCRVVLNAPSKGGVANASSVQSAYIPSGRIATPSIRPKN
jgi:penicillin-insensitive murein endopeptidase